MRLEELKIKIINDFKKINYDITKEYEFSNDIENWKKYNKDDFIYIENNNYIEESIDTEYYNSRTVNIKTDNIEEFLFEIYSVTCYGLAEQYAIKYKYKNNKNEIDLNRIIRIIQLNLLKQIDYKMFEKKYNKTIETYNEIPDLYNDNYGDNFDFSLLETE